MDERVTKKALTQAEFDQLVAQVGAEHAVRHVLDYLGVEIAKPWQDGDVVMGSGPTPAVYTRREGLWYEVPTEEENHRVYDDEQIDTHVKRGTLIRWTIEKARTASRDAGYGSVIDRHEAASVVLEVASGEDDFG